MSLATSLLLGACMALAQSSPQPLGDYARSVRKSNGTPSASGRAATASKQKVVYDNDTIPTTSSLSVVGNPGGSSSPASQDASATAQSGSSDEKKGEKKDDPKITPGQSIEERKQAYDAWKSKLDSQNEKITKLSHELDLLQREYQVKAAEFYSDAANRAQNPTGFAKQDADYKQQLAEKHQSVDAAKTQLNDMQESARKAGVPSSVTEPN